MGSCNSGGKGGGGGVSIRSVIGKQRKARTPSEALANTNPNYNQGKEWQVNCQRCVYAYELQRRGYDVEAQQRILNGTDPMNNGVWKNGFENQTWERGLGMRTDHVERNVVSKMQGWGDGSRAIVYVAWRSGNAHVFNIENEGGHVSIFDGQSGRKLSLSDYLLHAKPSSTMISRVDNLKPNVNVLRYAVKKKGT